MKRLSLLITHYNEPFSVVRPLLMSIAMQQGVSLDDIEVVLVNDGLENAIRIQHTDSCPYEFKVVTIEHAGVSAARNVALDNASGEYVMFCDCDDMFLSVCGLYVLLNELAQGEYDVMTSLFVEETWNNERYVYVNHDNVDCTFVHGKVYRRQYLIDNNIRWNEELTIHEDSYFNCMCQRIADEKRIRRCDSAFWLWKYRADSVCRRDPKYLLKTYPKMILSNRRMVEQFIQRGMKVEAEYYVTSMIFGTYFKLNCAEWLDEANKEYLDAVERDMAAYYKDFLPLLESTDELMRVEIVRDMKNRAYFDGLVIETFTFENWLDKLKQLSL